MARSRPARRCLYAIHRLRNVLGLSVRAFEAGNGVGGTWYWNRYPGARCDSDSYLYCYTFDDRLLQDWQWSERYPEQPEILRYLNHVADRFDLRKSVDFGTRVTDAIYDDNGQRWTIRTDNGDVVTAQFFVSAVGSRKTFATPKVRRDRGQGIRGIRLWYVNDLAASRARARKCKSSSLNGFPPDFCT